MLKSPWGKMIGVRPSKQLHRLLDLGFGYEQAYQIMHDKESISKEKFDLLWRVAQVERPIINESSDPALCSVYVGIPFCPSRCLYCSFPSHSLKELGMLRTRYVETLLGEIEASGKQVRGNGMSVFSVYVGGGTPTSLLPQELDRVLEALREAFPGNWREFSVEAGRPDSLLDEHLAVLKKHETSRISVNPQTMHSRTLQTIGRGHSAHDVEIALDLVRQYGFKVINMDMIIGLPGEDMEMVGQTASWLVSLAPENITIHVFARKRASRYNHAKNDFNLPPDHMVVAMYQTATRAIAGAYQPYYLYRQRDILGGLENVGFARLGTECIYNIVMIEERHTILGLGCGATSKFVNRDFSLLNISSPKDVRLYLERVGELVERRGKALSGRC